MNIVKELANTIAKRNKVSSEDAIFNAENIAEYLIIYRNQIVNNKQTPDEALSTLFGLN